MKKQITVLTLCAMLLALGFNAYAQPPAKVAKIGELVFRSRQDLGPAHEVFRRELHALGYVEGKNIAFEMSIRGGRARPDPCLADDLVRLKVDVLVATSTTEAIAFKNATKTIPVVFIQGTDPVTDGLVDSLARPGGNLTGFTNFAAENVRKTAGAVQRSRPRSLPVSRYCTIPTIGETHSRWMSFGPSRGRWG